MKRSALLLLALSLAGAGLLSAEDALPQGAGIDRYHVIWERSPFTVASSDEVPKATWILAGMTESETTPVLFLVNRDTQERMVVTKTPNAKGFSVESVHYDANPMRTSARIKVSTTDPALVTVTFDPALLVVNNPAPAGATAATAAAAAAPGAADAGGDRAARRARWANRRSVVPNPADGAAATPAAVAPAAVTPQPIPSPTPAQPQPPASNPE